MRIGSSTIVIHLIYPIRSAAESPPASENRIHGRKLSAGGEGTGVRGDIGGGNAVAEFLGRRRPPSWDAPLTPVPSPPAFNRIDSSLSLQAGGEGSRRSSLMSLTGAYVVL